MHTIFHLLKPSSPKLLCYLAIFAPCLILMVEGMCYFVNVEGGVTVLALASCLAYE